MVKIAPAASSTAPARTIMRKNENTYSLTNILSIVRGHINQMGREGGHGRVDRTPKSVIAKDVNAVVKPVFLRILIVDAPLFAQRGNGLEDLTDTRTAAAAGGTSGAGAAAGSRCGCFGYCGRDGWRQTETLDDGCVIGMRRRSKGRRVR
jgi:hypothetical protein